MDELSIHFGENIAELRRKSGLTQPQLADLLGFKSHKRISNWEKGISVPPVDICVRIATIFGLTLDQLILTTIKNVQSDAPQIDDPVQRTQVVEQLRDLEQKVLKIANQLETEKENREILLQKLAEYEQVMDDLKKNYPPSSSK